MLHNLKLWQKLALSGAIFMLPFAAVTYTMIASIDDMGVAFARRELQGLRLYEPHIKLVRDLQQHRSLAAAVLSGDSSFKERLARNNDEIETDLKAITDLAPSSAVADRAAALAAASREVVTNTARFSVPESFQRHTAAIAQAVALVRSLGDAYKISRDPEPDTKPLMTMVVVLGPELTEYLGQARAVGGAMISSRKWTGQQLEHLARLADLAEYLDEKIDRSMTDGFAANDGVRRELGDFAQLTRAHIADAVRRIRGVAAAEQVDLSADDYYNALTKSIDSVFDLQSRSVASLNALLTARVAKFQRAIFVTLGWAALGLLVASIIGFAIMRDIARSLADAIGVASRIAVGDVSVSHAARRRSDEIGVLSHAFDRMIVALNDQVAVAERIARGDLTVKVQPRSEQDVLALALSHMVAQLSRLVGEVDRSGQQVNTSVSEIAATAKQQQATATEIAATTTQIGATSREISATSKELVRTMTEVSAVAEASASLASNGQSGLTRMEDTMQQVMEAAASINGRLAVLNEKAGNINQVVTTITKVADQTNLLSLNAAIEAEKAGEYGRGFAVVATEIRRLADQTAVATYDIAQMVKDIQSAVSAGVMGMDKFSEEVKRGMQDVQQVSRQLSQVIHQVQALAPRFDAVNEGMQAQATGAEQITQALAQLSEAAQQTVDSLRQSNQTIDSLNQAATGMRSGVARFTLAA